MTTNPPARPAELRALVQDFLLHFRMVDAASTTGPHAALSLQEVRVVEYLGDRGARMMRELAEFLVLAVNSVTNIVDNLERKALVRRVRSEDDRRVVLVELTATGLTAHAAAVADKERFLSSLLAGLTAEEQGTYLRLMRKVATAGRAELGLKAAE